MVFGRGGCGGNERRLGSRLSILIAKQDGRGKDRGLARDYQELLVRRLLSVRSCPRRFEAGRGSARQTNTKGRQDLGMTILCPKCRAQGSSVWRCSRLPVSLTTSTFAIPHSPDIYRGRKSARLAHDRATPVCENATPPRNFDIGSVTRLILILVA
jgi:hypothetical protein